MRSSRHTADNPGLDVWATSMALPDTPQSTEAKPGQISNNRYRREEPYGASVACSKAQAMDEVTHRVQNIRMRNWVPAAKANVKSAETVIKEAHDLETRGTAEKALKIVQMAVKEQVPPLYKLMRFEDDLKRRIRNQKNLNRDATQRAIRGALSRPEVSLIHPVSDDIPHQTPGNRCATALSFNSMHDHGTAGIAAPNSTSTVGSETPKPLPTPILPSIAMSSPLESPSGVGGEEEHTGIGVRMLPSAPAASPLLEPVAFHSASEDPDRTSAIADTLQDPSVLLAAVQGGDCPGSERSGRLRQPSELEPCQSHSMAFHTRTRSKSGVRFSEAPPTHLESEDGDVWLGEPEWPASTATPKGTRCVAKAGRTSWSEQAGVHRATTAEPTTCILASACVSPLGKDGVSWAAGGSVRTRLSANAGRTPRRPSSGVAKHLALTPAHGERDAPLPPAGEAVQPERSRDLDADDPVGAETMRGTLNAGYTSQTGRKSQVHFAQQPTVIYDPSKMMLEKEELSTGGDIGSEDWSLAICAVTPGGAPPTAEFGDVDKSPDSDGGLKDDETTDAPWIVADAMVGVPRCTPQEVARLGMHAGHTPAPSRPASVTDEILAQDEDDSLFTADAVGHTVIVPPAPQAAESRGVGELQMKGIDAAAQLNFNTHDAEHVSGVGHKRCVKFAANTADITDTAGGRASVGSVITPFALQQTVQLGARSGLQMPSTQSVLARVPEQRTSMRALRAGSLFPTPKTTQGTPSLAVGGAAGEGATCSVAPRRPTPATGAVHVPYDQMEFEEETSSEDVEPDESSRVSITADAEPEGEESLSSATEPEVQAMPCSTPVPLVAQPAIEPSGTAEGGKKGAGLALQVPSAEGDMGSGGMDSLDAALLSDDAIASAASPGHSSISFGSPARSAWGGFATPGSEASTPSISRHRSVDATPPRRLDTSLCADSGPAPQHSSVGPSPLSQPEPLPSFTAAGGFMPELPADADVTDAPEFTLEAPTPPPATSFGAAAASVAAPATGDSVDTDDLLREDSLDGSEGLQEHQQLRPEEAPEGILEADNNGQEGDVERQLEAAFTKLSVADTGRPSAAAHQGGNRELKALMTDTVATQVAAAADEMGTHEVLVPVKAAPGQRSVHGTPRVLTPVRRSRRSMVNMTPPPDISAQLQETQWTYSPNPALGHAHVAPSADEDDGL